MELARNEEELVLKNMGLVRNLVKNLGVFPNSSQYEDLISEGTIGLINAIRSFEPSKGYKFSTYATTCIKYAIFTYLGKIKDDENTISIDEPLTNDEQEFSLRDILEAPDSSCEEKMEKREEFIKIITIILNYLKRNNRIVMLYKIGGISKKDIAKKSQYNYTKCIENSTNIFQPN